MSSERQYILSVALDMLAKHEDKIPVFTNDGTKVILPKRILAFFSPFVSTLMSSVSPCHSSALILPDCSLSSLSSLGDILENGFTSSRAASAHSEVILAAKLLKVNMENLDRIDDSMTDNDIMNMISEKNNLHFVSKEHEQNEAEKDSEEEHVEKDDMIMPTIQIQNSFTMSGANFDDVKSDIEEITVEDEPDVEEITVEECVDKTQHNCKLCEEDLDSLEALLYHYCSHFEQELLLKAASMSEGKTCLHCKRTFEDLDSVFILHFGLYHAKIIEILKEKNIGNYELSESTKQVATQEVDSGIEASLSSTGNRPVECQICQKKGHSLQILLCYSVHFFKELRALLVNLKLLKGLDCKICGSVFSSKINAVKHIGTTHGKVNILLKQKGFSEIPFVDPPGPRRSRNGKLRKNQKMPLPDRVANAYEYLLSSGTVESNIMETSDERKDNEVEDIKTSEPLLNHDGTLWMPDKGNGSKLLPATPEMTLPATSEIKLSTNSEMTLSTNSEMTLSTYSEMTLPTTSEMTLQTNPVMSLPIVPVVPLPATLPVEVPLIASPSEPTRCEICSQDVGKYSKLMPHYHGHLAGTVRKRYSSLMNLSDGSIQCRLCSHVAKSEMTLVAHISMKHKKLNEILVERGIKPVQRKGNHNVSLESYE